LTGFWTKSYEGAHKDFVVPLVSERWSRKNSISSADLPVAERSRKPQPVGKVYAFETSV